MAESTVLELKQNEIGDRKQRNSNLELMRILLMLGMIAHHYVVNSGVEALYDLSAFSWDVWFLQIFGMFGKTGINCFTLLTGYFMVKSNITLKKFLKLYLEVKFYYIGCYLLFLVTGYEPFSALTLKSAVFNVLYELNWLYTGTYIVFFLFIPFLNALMGRLSRRQHGYLLLLGFCYYTLISTFTGADTFSYLGWMAVMYLLGGYLSLYGSRLPFWGSLRFAAAGLAISLALMCFSVAAIDLWGVPAGFDDYYYFGPRLSQNPGAFLFRLPVSDVSEPADRAKSVDQPDRCLHFRHSSASHQQRCHAAVSLGRSLRRLRGL